MARGPPPPLPALSGQPDAGVPHPPVTSAGAAILERRRRRRRLGAPAASRLRPQEGRNPSRAAPTPGPPASPPPSPHDCPRPRCRRTSPQRPDLTRKPGSGAAGEEEGKPVGPASQSARRGASAGAMTSLTQRSSGLVQRRTEASRSAADKERAAGGGGGSGEDDAQSRRDEQDDDDKGDSKETRLTLMEEVLLLGLKDREVRAGRGGRRGPSVRPRSSGAPRSSPHRRLGFSLPPVTPRSSAAALAVRFLLASSARPTALWPVDTPGHSPHPETRFARGARSQQPRAPGFCRFQDLGGPRGSASWDVTKLEGGLFGIF